MNDGIRVLYVDDEPDLRRIVTMSLKLDPQLEVRTCEDGREGLEVAEEWQPALILLDMMMPGLDGIATHGLLRANPATCDIPVAFVTGVAHSDERRLLEKAGAVGIIAKPFDCTRLAQTVRSLLSARSVGLAR